MTGDDRLDPAAFERLLEITGGDVAFVDELIDTYLDDAVVQLDALRQAASADDAAAIVRPAHSLKSSSANVGAVALTSLCRALEADGRTGSIPDAVARVAAADHEFELIRTGLLEARATR